MKRVSCASGRRRGWSVASKRPVSLRGHTVDEYRERLTFELGVIAGMKYPGYFLIVSDFINGRRSKAYQSDPAAVRARARSFHTR